MPYLNTSGQPSANRNQDKPSNIAKSYTLDKGSDAEYKYLPAIQDKTGFNNIRLQRPNNGRVLGDCGLACSLSESQSVDSGDERLFNPYVMFIDYLRGEVLLDSYRGLQEFLKMLFPAKTGKGISDTVADLPYVFALVPGVRQYEYGYKDTQTGAIVAYQPVFGSYCNVRPQLLMRLMEIDPLLLLDFSDEAIDGYRVLIQLGGDYFRGMPLIYVFRLLKYLDGKNFRCQRLDLATDIPKSFGLLRYVVLAEFEKRFTNVTVSQYIRSGSIKKQSETVYLGSRQSNFFMRFYDDEVKHGYKADRAEGEFKGDKSRQVFRLLADLPFYNDPNDKMSRKTNLEILRTAQRLMSNLLTGQLDFYDNITRACNGSITAITYCDWWLDFKDKILAYNPIRVTVQPPEKTIPKTFAWLFRQVSKSLAIFYSGMKGNGAKLIKALLDYGKERFTNQDEALICTLKAGLVNLEIG